MNIQYRREMSHNYLIVEPELKLCVFETEMMLRNKIKGLLKLKLQQADGKTTLYYDITSKQPLDRLLEKNELGGEDIRRLISGILETVKRLDAYLLQENHLALKPELVYIEPHTCQVFLCLIPGYEGEFQAEFCRFLQYLLGKTDHQDKEGVVLMYGLYQESLKENCGIDDIFQYLYKKGSPNDIGRADGIEAAQIKNDEAGEAGDIRRDTWFLGRVGSNDRMQVAEEAASYHVESGHVSGDRHPLRWLKRVFGSGDERKETVEREPETTDISQEQILNRIFEDAESSLPEEGILQRKQIGQQDKQELQGKPGLQGKTGQQGSPGYLAAEQNTTLLSEHGAVESVRKLVSADGVTEDIPLSYFPFIIGKQEALADYALNRETVSRMHLRIDYKDGEYRVTDLNSTNGTCVRGRLLENNEEVELYPGDEIWIAEYRFLFV